LLGLTNPEPHKRFRRDGIALALNHLQMRDQISDAADGND
jgi:hypothetical protein